MQEARKIDQYDEYNEMDARLAMKLSEITEPKPKPTVDMLLNVNDVYERRQ